jgi:hypothetical protein
MRKPPPATRYLLGRNDPNVIGRVVGLVALWGDVCEGVDGWRGGFAYPARIWVPASPHATEVADALEVYRVPVDVLAARRSADIASALAA